MEREKVTVDHKEKEIFHKEISNILSKLSVKRFQRVSTSSSYKSENSFEKQHRSPWVTTIESYSNIDEPWSLMMRRCWSNLWGPVDIIMTLVITLLMNLFRHLWDNRSSLANASAWWKSLFFLGRICRVFFSAWFCQISFSHAERERIWVNRFCDKKVFLRRPKEKLFFFLRGTRLVSQQQEKSRLQLRRRRESLHKCTRLRE